MMTSNTSTTIEAVLAPVSAMAPVFSKSSELVSAFEVFMLETDSLKRSQFFQVNNITTIPCGMALLHTCDPGRKIIFRFSKICTASKLYTLFGNKIKKVPECWEVSQIKISK